MMSERGFDRRDILGRHTDAIGERTQDGLRLFEGCEGACPESLMTFLKLFQHIEAGADFRLTPRQVVELHTRRIQCLLDLMETFLALLDGTPMGLSVEFAVLDMGSKFADPRLQMRSFLFELNFFRSQLFQANDITLFLQVQRIDLGPGFRQLLQRCKPF